MKAIIQKLVTQLEKEEKVQLADNVLVGSVVSAGWERSIFYGSVPGLNFSLLTPGTRGH